ncbi:hypothetical protein [Sphingomonas sp. SRS2]|uniref:hypothetical protein n=1 Tax=Sphingomonas sp. SRS2 TaxID=133190 RepID=UPI00061847A7|nr:hypothetical protein [Sphingomonas sp. SRS2]KKC27314.1 hypothetical protein WP12_03980 [Sphingomonas sp. SRS2]
MIALHDRGWPQQLLNLDRILSIGEPTKTGDRTVHRVRLDGDELLDLHGHEVDRIRIRAVQMMPAAPGTAMIFPYRGDDGEMRGWNKPVIAWAICIDGEVRPVTPGGVNDGAPAGDFQFGVLMPDGRVIIGDLETYDSVEAYLADRAEATDVKA